MIKIIYDEENLAILDKPAGISMHPPTPNQKTSRRTSPATVADFMIKRFSEIKKEHWENPERAGIVHRLDQDTSGLVIIAKNPIALQKLQGEFKKHAVQKQYTALVFGKPSPEKGTIDIALQRDQDKSKMKVAYLKNQQSKRATTEYKVIKYYPEKNVSLLEINPETGRMHQIRVHLKYLGHPIIGDQVYFNKASKKLSEKLGLTRQFLHASKLSFTDPMTNKKMNFSSELPNDLKLLINS